MIDPILLMIEVIKENTPNSKWVNAPLESFRQVANTNRGDIGEEFIVRLLTEVSIPVEKSANRMQEWDLTIQGKRYEVKTASEDTSGMFQFNHIRLDRKYDRLLCLGIRPDEILFNLWRKGEVAEGKAGTLVRMAEGQSITFKLTKKPQDMRPINVLPSIVRETAE